VKRTLLLVRGNVSHPLGIIGAYWYWFRFEQWLRHGRKYAIRVLETPTLDQLLAELVAADAVVLYGHGSADGKGFLLDERKFRHGEVATRDLVHADFLREVAAYQSRRLDFAFNASCYSLRDPETVHAWLQISAAYTGFFASTFSFRPADFSLPRTIR